MTRLFAPPRVLSRSDQRAFVKEAMRRLDNPARRRFLKGAASVGAFALLSGCDITDGISAEGALRAMSDFNDRVQAALFDPVKLAEEFPESAVTRPFPFNAFYPREEAPAVDPADYALEVSGLIDRKDAWTLDKLYALPQVSQITRHVCIEGWTAIGKWSGVRFADFLKLIGADLSARYVGFTCADGYATSIDMPTALHPQTQLTFRFMDEVLPRIYGFPMKLRMPTKLGYKNPKHITEIFVTNDYPGGYWETYGYNWFSGL
ncbi:MAG: molybdopterin-dependent oxidoreductase [Methylobacteriaceae bacterium]|nr:molybdopterin-dependent oxidoreductase [Methylobacteriaceae bacterium]